MAAIGAELVVDTLRGLQTGAVTPHPQDHEKSTLAPILKKEDGLIDFSRPAADIVNRMRGFQPWPGAYTRFRGKNLQVLKAAAVVSRDISKPGEMQILRDRLLVSCSRESALEIIEVQLEGKKHSSARDFLHGYRITSGEKLGE